VAKKKQIPYNQRFNIRVPGREAERRFLNRVNDQIFKHHFLDNVDERVHALHAAAFELGEEYDPDYDFANYVRGEFHRCLQVIEGGVNPYDWTERVRRAWRGGALFS
jgi:hypothetical protein